ncbi:MAG: DNA repair protein RadC [Bacteroidia bacterium]|nr:DNA repair protein RadC [Bacteroidia bacterium]
MTQYYTNIPIRMWAAEDRPREKLMQRGIESLIDAELLAILFGTGTREQSALDLARSVLEDARGLPGLARATLQDLTQTKGIGPAKAISILAAFELGRRKSMVDHQVFRITRSEDAARYLMARMGDLDQEVFYVLFLNQNNEIKGEKAVFKGGIAATVVDTRVIFKEALSCLAAGVILAHNHPSGNLTPSEADRQITRKLHAAGQVLDIRVLDHLIISSRGFYSFADEGVMPK